jgi:hypothetical protein
MSNALCDNSLSSRERLGERGVFNPLILSFSLREKGPCIQRLW